MKTVARNVNIYKFHELNKDVQNRIVEEGKIGYFEWEFDLDFQDLCKYDLIDLFPHSDLKVQYDFSCCQGSGLNIYGNFSLEDFANFPEFKTDDLNWLFNVVRKINFPENRSYCYSLKDILLSDVQENVYNEFNNYTPEDPEDWMEDEIFRIVKIISEHLKHEEYILWKSGEEMIDDEKHIISEIECQNNWYYENGQIIDFEVEEDEWE